MKETYQQQLEKNNNLKLQYVNELNRTSNPRKCRDLRYAIFSIRQDNILLEYNILNS